MRRRMSPASSRGAHFDSFRPGSRSPRGLVLICALSLFALLAACAQTTVIREPSTQRGKPAVRSAPKPGATAVVRKGDTLYRIATQHGLSPLDLAMWNRIAPPHTIYPGQRLRLSPPSSNRPVAARPPTGRPPTSAPPATRPPATSRPPANPPIAGSPAASPKPPQIAAPKPPATPVAPPASAFSWRWPADGAIVARYAAGDPTKQGIGIGGQNGAPVRAAADGVVVYSGAGLIGYGELVIVKHSEEWLSAYGHNRARLVNEGQRVKAGDQIAELGRSGAARDMLHFEIRHNGRPMDPLAYLPKR
jgi:lipoprotein NlpD